jgi:hypothetical protein
MIIWNVVFPETIDQHTSLTYWGQNRKGSDDGGLQQSELLGFWTLSNVRIAKWYETTFVKSLAQRESRDVMEEYECIRLRYETNAVMSNAA